MKRSKTNTIGNKGEALIHNLVEAMGFTIVKKWSNNSRWDMVITDGDAFKSLEVKTQPEYKKYGGFSVEVGNKRLGNYVGRDAEFHWYGSPCVYTGLAVTQADTQVFTNGINIVYLVSTKSMIEWFQRVKTQEEHRIKFGGYDGRSLQVQITVEELEEIGKKIDLRKKKGRKPKVASS